MAEKEGDHRRRIESHGQYFAFGIAVIGLCASAAVIIAGQPIGGSVLASGVLVSLVTAFIVDRRSES
jgi:hypothetical protein